MKRFALNKIKIAKLANLKTIKGGLEAPIRGSLLITECVDETNDCTADGCMSIGAAPCTNTSIDGQLTTDPVGTNDTIPL